MKNPKISLVVCSNRENQKYQNIWNRLRLDLSQIHIILLTQGKANHKQDRSHNVIHIKLESIGRSRAINSGLRIVKTGYIGLTDDDCIIDEKWLTQAVKTLDNYSFDLVYGQTKPYLPNKHIGQFCPSTFSKISNVVSVTNNIGKHWENVGFDNNAVIKKRVFDNIGGYKWWLGPGSIIPAGEDAEFILRAQIARHKIAYNPDMIVYHNKWLNTSENEKLMHNYALGGLTVYSFYALQGVKECSEIMFEYIHQFIDRIKFNIKQIVKQPYNTNCYIKEIMLNLFYLSKGLIIAYVFARIIPISSKENVVRRFYR